MMLLVPGVTKFFSQVSRILEVTRNSFGIVDLNVQPVEGQDEITFIPFRFFSPPLPDLVYSESS